MTSLKVMISRIMQTRFIMDVPAWPIIFIIAFSPFLCRAHSRDIHKKISESAALSSDGFKSFLNDYFEVQGTPSLDSPPLWLYGFPDRGANTTYSPIDWIRWGSYDEDDTAAIRSSDHFYTVNPLRQPGLSVPGLTDWSEFLGLGWVGVRNSFAWAVVPGATAPFPSLEENIYGWGNARDYEYKSLTDAGKGEREKYLAAVLYALGHVIHLNQDLSQPDHVRNNEHAIKHWIEAFGARTFLKDTQFFTQQRRGWADWQSKGFNKLLDFWDRDHYHGGASALDDDNSLDFNASPAFKLGQ